MDQLSQFHFYSYGIVASNKKLGLKETAIEVMPMEALPMVDGEVTENTQTITGKGTDKDNNSYDSEVASTVTLRAEWLPMCEPNRLTAPDVRRGAKVMIYRFGDSDQYFWTSHERDNLKRLETVVYGWNGSPDDNQESTIDDYYIWEISTHKGAVTFYTSKKNGEPFRYIEQLNTKEGNWTLTDDIGNEYYLDSKLSQLRIKSHYGTFFEILGKDLNYHVLGNFKGKVDGDYSVEVGKSISYTAKNEITLHATAINNNAPAINNIGNFNTQPGREGTTGAGKMRGDVEIDGNVRILKDLDVSGEIRTRKLYSQQDIEAPNV